MFFPFFTRSVLLPGKDGTAGKTITPSECVWHVPCLSPPLPHGSASIASNRRQPCDVSHRHTPLGGLQGSSFFTLSKSLSSNFLPLFSLLSFARGAHHIFVDFYLPHLWCYFKATRQEPLGVDGGEADSKRKEIWHWLHLVDVCNTKSKTAHWQEQSTLFSFFFFVFSLLYCGEQRLFFTHCPSHPVHWFPVISTFWCVDSPSLSLFFVKNSSLQYCHLRTCGIWEVVWGIRSHLPSPFLPLIDWELARASLDCLTWGTLPCRSHVLFIHKNLKRTAVSPDSCIKYPYSS